MKFVIHEFSLETNGQYLDVTVNSEGFMAFKITDSDKFEFTEKEWRFIKIKIDEEFKRLKKKKIIKREIMKKQRTKEEHEILRMSKAFQRKQSKEELDKKEFQRNRNKI